MFMKTFEEKWTAWIDDQLTGRELEEFLASLPHRASAEAEKQNAKQVGSLLREQAMALSNADFFSHQLRERLDRENVPVRSEVDTVPTGWWTIRRLLWGGITSLAVFAICTVLVFRERTPSSQSQYLTQILGAQVDPTVSPNATISMFEMPSSTKKDDHVTVLWVDGLQSLPPEYAAK
jgi:negative regulator of sigma E activity